MAMRKSLTKPSMEIEKVAGPMPSESGAWSTSSTTSKAGELAVMTAAMAANTMTAAAIVPLEVTLWTALRCSMRLMTAGSP